ncbi:hypothetical protein NX059_004465 [Plenodomus lindquistii]|nr:hypothetical protein NX059_004465 [Plenodomus lindquistii]
MALSNNGEKRQIQKPSCLSDEAPSPKAIASEIYTVLPLELRNRVYTFCMQGSYDNEVIIRRSTNNGNAFDFLVREPLGPHAYVWVEDPTTSYIGAARKTADVAREMLEAYYWTRVFKFSHRELDLLETFLRCDLFGLGTIAMIYARRLHIQLRPFAGAERSPEHDTVEQQRCHRAIVALAAIQSARTEVVVQFNLDQGFLGCADYTRFSPEDENILFQVISDLITLKERGLHIEIVFSGTWNEHPSTRIRSRSICSPEECMVRLTGAAQQAYPGEATCSLDQCETRK